MRSSKGSTAFKVFDKAIVAVLAVLALYFVVSAFVKEPADPINRQMVDRLIDQAKQKRARSTHRLTALDRDYLAATIGGFRPDSAGHTPRRFIFGEEPGVAIALDWKRPMTVVKSREGVTSPVERKIPDEAAGAQIRVGDMKVVRVELQKEAILVHPLTEGRTVIEFLKKDGQSLAKIDVEVKLRGEELPRIYAPPRFAATPGSGVVNLRWLPARKSGNAKVTEYRIYRSEQEEKQELYLRVPIEAGAEPGASLPTVRPDKSPGPPAVLRPGGFGLKDPDVQGDVDYWYCVDAAGTTEDGKAKVQSARSPGVRVRVAEPFTIEFHTRSPQIVALYVSVRVVDPKGEDGKLITLTHQFQVECGQPVGWKTSDVTLPLKRRVRWRVDGKEQLVDFTTGYQLFGILTDERRVKWPKGKRGREQEEKTQKVLLINDRNRIKVFWPTRRR